MFSINARLSAFNIFPEKRASLNFIRSSGLETIPPAPKGIDVSVSLATFQLSSKVYDFASLFEVLIQPPK